MSPKQGGASIENDDQSGVRNFPQLQLFPQVRRRRKKKLVW